MRVLERDIERKVVRFATELGCAAVKLNGRGQRSWPDRLFVGRRGVIWVEFKRPGGRLTPLQRLCHERLCALNQDVVIVVDAAVGKALVKQIA